MAAVTFTEEQQGIICLDETPSLLRVQAFAGTGKTFTLLHYALARPDVRFLYVVFNRSMRDEAMQKFPNNVETLTSHQLAFRALGAKYKHKLAPGLRLRDIAQIIGGDGRRPNYYLARVVLDTLQAFIISADPRLDHRHLPPEAGKWVDRGAKVIQYAQALWRRMIDPEDPSVKMIHDGYLKLFQLSNPDLSKRYDAILFDEAQDSNPVTNALILKQPLPKVYVGDRHQQIYAFRGAINALEGLRADVSKSLTTSFRFGEATASYANQLLSTYKGETKPLTGAGPETLIDRLPADGKPFALLHRTFAECFNSAVRAVRAGRTLGWVGGIENYDLRSIEDLYYLSAREYDRIRDPRLRTEYPSFEEYREVAEESDDVEMKRRIKIVDTYGEQIPELMDLIRARTVRNLRRATLVLSTAHRAKGMEFERVCLTDDFKDLHDPKMSEEDREQEANLLYVAITRATHHLQIPPSISHMILTPPTPKVLVSIRAHQQQGLKKAS